MAGIFNNPFANAGILGGGGGGFAVNGTPSLNDKILKQKYLELQAVQLQNTYNQIQNVAPALPSPYSLDPAKLKALQATPPRRVGQRVPDAVTPLIAWRAWGLRNNGGGYQLSALGQDSRWPAREVMEATCATGTDRHPAPHKSCECGIWAFRDLDKLTQAAAKYNFQVLGQVNLWGRIIECENGFRAQFAYPHELWLLDDSLEELGYTYGVPIRSIPSAR